VVNESASMFDIVFHHLDGPFGATGDGATKAAATEESGTSETVTLRPRRQQRTETLALRRAHDNAWTAPRGVASRSLSATRPLLPATTGSPTGSPRRSTPAASRSPIGRCDACSRAWFRPSALWAELRLSGS